MRTGSWLAALLVAGCGDPVLDLEIDARAFPDLALAVRVVAPPPAQRFDCEAIAFGDVPLESALIHTERQAMVGDRASFLGLERGDPKLILAEGFASAGPRAAIGCADLPATIEDGAALSLSLEPVTRLAIPEGPTLQAELDRGLDAPVEVAVSDRAGSPLAAARVRWRIFAAGSDVVRGEVASDSVGRATLAPAVPRSIGPFMLELRSRWAELDPPRIPGFSRSSDPPVPLSGGELVVAKLGPRGELVRAERRGGDLLRCAGERFADCSPWRSNVAGDGAMFPLEGFELSDGTDRLLVIGGGGWLVVDRTGDGVDWAIATPVRAPLPGGGCTAGDPMEPRLVIQDASGIHSLARGGERQTIAPGGPEQWFLLDAGCVASDGPAPLRTVLGFNFEARIAVAFPAGHAPVLWPGPARTFGFGIDRRSGDRFLLGAQQVLSGLGISRARWRLAGGQPSVETLAFHPIPAPAIQVRAGDVDGDGTIDLLAVLDPSDQSSDCVNGCLLWIALGGANAIAGALPLPGWTHPRIFAGDVDGDGAEEVVVVNATTAPSMRVLRIGAR